MINLSNATYADLSNGTTELVSAAANTNGVIIHLAILLTVQGAGNSGYIKKGDDYIGRIQTADNTAHAIKLEKIFVPAGEKVEIHSSSASVQIIIYYEVLS